MFESLKLIDRNKTKLKCFKYNEIKFTFDLNEPINFN